MMTEKTPRRIQKKEKLMSQIGYVKRGKAQNEDRVHVASTILVGVAVDFHLAAGRS